MSDRPSSDRLQLPLAELVLLKTGPFGSSLHKSDYVPGGVPVVNPMHIVGGRIVPSDDARIGQDVLERLADFQLAEGDVVLGRRGEMGRCAVVGAREAGWLCGTGSLIIRQLGALDPRYLYRFLSSPEIVQRLEGESVGSTMVNLNQGILRGLEVPVPPLSEQRRIAEKLDALLARVDACRERLDRVPDILNRFRQSVLAAATSGKLTKEWREARGGSKDIESWVSARLVDLCVLSRVITYGVIKLGMETPRGVPCLRTSNVRWLRIDTAGMKRIAPALSAEFGRTVLQGGEVLVNVRGTLGGVAVVEPTMGGWNVSREVAVVPVDNSRVESQFLAFWIGSEDRQRWLSKVEKGVAYTGINIEDLRKLPVSVPPLDEQREIVRRVQVLLQFADGVELRLGTGTQLIDPLKRSLLAAAFRGDLVPKEPSDEPASKVIPLLRSDSMGKARRST